MKFTLHHFELLFAWIIVYWISEIMNYLNSIFRLDEEVLTLPIFSIMGMEIVALFSRPSISYMEIVVKPASLDYSCTQSFETQTSVSGLIFTNGKVNYCLCAFDWDLWTQNVFLLFLAPPLAMCGCMLISPLATS